MNSGSAILVSSLAVGFGAVSAYFAFSKSSAEAALTPAPGPVAAATDAALLAAIERLQGEVSAIQEQLSLASVASDRAPAAISDGAIERAVAAYFDANGATGAAPEAQGLDLEAPLGTPAEIAEMLNGADQVEAMGLWKRLVEEGLDDEVLAHYKALAQANPEDPEAQLALGQAYLGRTQEANGPMAGFYATLADKALNQALAADPEHWEARFTKATALSFWPPNLGKQPEAIREFEHLIAQQSGMAQTPAHAQSHFTLGNLYQQNGQMDKALDVWRNGLTLFPDNAQLAEQIRLVEGD